MKIKAALTNAARRGFSLIEVVLAVGIVAFAMVAILGLFGSSLQSTQQVDNQDEALGIVRALPAYLQSQSFQTVYGWVQTPSTMPALYGYTLLPSPLQSGTDSAQQTVIHSGTDTALTTGSTSYTHRQGRMFAIQLSLSPNMPMHLLTTSTTVTLQPTASQLPVSSTSYGEAVLPIRAAIYPVPIIISGTNPIPAGTYPAFTYDTTVSR